MSSKSSPVSNKSQAGAKSQAARGVKPSRGRAVAKQPQPRPSPGKDSAGQSKKKTSARGSAARKAERRAQLLEVATRVFAQRGYARTTVDDITNEAGVARGTFYLYFDDKRDLFQELVDQFAERITLTIVRIVTDDPQRPVSEQVLDNIRGILGVCLRERSMTKILFTGAVGTDSEFEHKMTRFYDDVVQLLTESLQDGQDLGIVNSGEPRVMAYMTIGALKELLYQAVTLGLSGESTEALTTQVYDFLCSGYLRVESRASDGQASKARRRT